MSDQETSTDSNTSVSDLRELVREFVEERNWKKFHSPKNLSMALAIEAGELMEHFQWITTAESRELDEEKKAEVGEELADVLCYSMAIANEMGIEIASTL
jgi:NTP pyrophosphatase (non-canonical NTP hydrolase)